MWQEAKKHEKLIRGIMIDYKQRAERRKGFYDKIKKDPAEFLQVWGIQSKIHIDASLAQAADNPSIMTKWNGDENTLIDRFDARSHLDYLPEYKESKEQETFTDEDRMLNYERYRTLVQNEAVGITESQCLKQIEIDEKHGNTASNQTEKKSKEPKAQIGYVYQDSTPNYIHPHAVGNKSPGSDASDHAENDEDLDLALEIEKLTAEHKVILNKCAINYGMDYGDYIRMLVLDKEEKEKIKMNKLLEAEKAQYSGRKSRRERRIVKERLRKERGDISPLSYVIAKSPEKENNSSRSQSRSRSNSSSRSKKKSRFRSRSPSESKKNAVHFITSFGGDDHDEDAKHSSANKLSALKSLVKSKPAEKLIETKMLNLKRLKQNASHLPRYSRSPSKSPETSNNKTNDIVFRKSHMKNESKPKSMDISTDSSNETSDEEEALKKYLKRRESRKQVLDVREDEKLNEASNDTNVNVESFNAVETSSSCNNISNDSGGLATKFRSAEEFKSYQEKLKKKMQKQINSQLKKDKEIEKDKRKKEIEERREREAELNYLSEKMRLRRLRERKKKRDEEGDCSTSDSSSSNRSSPRRSRSTQARTRHRSRSKSISRSPARKSVQKASRSPSTSRRRYAKSNSSSRSRSRTRKPRRTSRSNSRARSSRQKTLSRSNSRRRKVDRKSSSSSSSTSSSTSSSSSSSTSSSD